MTKPLSGVRADQKLSHRKLEGVAAYVRRQLGYSQEVAIHPLRLFEDLHEIEIMQRDGSKIPLWGHVAHLDNSEGYARYDRDRKVIEIVSSVSAYEWLRNGHPRGAYFVGHELGHCLLHTDQLIRLAQMPTNQQATFHRGQAPHKTFEDTEWQANAFSSALLMPALGIAAIERENGYITANLLVQKFGVSYEAANYRIELFEKRRGELLN